MADFDIHTWSNQFLETNNADESRLSEQSTLLNDSLAFSPEAATSARSETNPIPGRQPPRTQTSAGAPTGQPRASRRRAEPSALSIALGIALAIAVLFIAYLLRSPHPVVHPPTGRNNKCTQVSSRYGQLTGFPPLHPINLTAYEAVYSELRDSQILTRLMDEQSKLNTSLKEINLDFIGNFGCLIRESPLSLSNDTLAAFKKEMMALSKQFGTVHSTVSRLRTLYRKISAAYQSLTRSAARNAEAMKPNDGRRYVMTRLPVFMMPLQPIIAPKNWESWQMANKVSKKAVSGMSALQREITRIQELLELSKHLDRELQHSINMSTVWEAPFGNGEKLMVWFRQKVGYSLLQGEEATKVRQFERWWAGLKCACHSIG